MALYGFKNHVLEGVWVGADTIIITMTPFVQFWRYLSNKSARTVEIKDMKILKREASELNDVLEEAEENIDEDGGFEFDAFDDKKKLDIEEDYYSLAYVSFIRLHQIKHDITNADLSNIFFNVLFVFTF